MKTELGITDTNRQAVANELAKILADENVLYIKTENAHWNIEGADFYDKHKFFESQFGQLDEFINSVPSKSFFWTFCACHLKMVSQFDPSHREK